jgi:two-component system NtrC family sensor kinase
VTASARAAPPAAARPPEGGGPAPALARALDARLAVRLGVRLVAGSAVILLLAGWWNLRLERQHLTALMSASADRIAETIRGSTRDAMLRNDADALHRTIENIGAQRGIVRVRVFNKEGRIRTSNRREEVGTLVDIRAEQCYGCHQQGRPLVALERKDRVRLFDSAEGQRVLGIIAPIHNEAQCAGACHVHPPTQRVLGVLDVQLSMDTVEEAIAASQRQLASALTATVAAVALLAGLLLWRMVLRPVRHFRAAIARVGAGELPARVPVLSRDEIGGMARSWNLMTEELQRARGELQEWNRTLERRVDEKTVALERAHARMLMVEKMASLGKLAAVVAHELNNPLAGIRTFARLLRRRLAAAPPAPAAADEAETRRILEMIEHESARCGDIVRNMLLFGRTSDARFNESEVGPLVERCAALVRHKAEMSGVTLEVEPLPRLPALVCDASQVEQMLLALALNAIEATPAGGRVSLAARALGTDADIGGADSVVLEVEDTGCGIAPEQRAHVFEPFFTTKEAGSGVGLGLAVVYGIVERHHGHVEFESRPGQGTVFRVHLPRRQPPRGAPAADPAETAQATTAVRG